LTRHSLKEGRFRRGIRFQPSTFGASDDAWYPRCGDTACLSREGQWGTREQSSDNERSRNERLAALPFFPDELSGVGNNVLTVERNALRISH
jgi:hypothetical protein